MIRPILAPLAFVARHLDASHLDQSHGGFTRRTARQDEASGLTHLMNMIAGTDLAVVHQFQNMEIIRHGLVARIEALYSQQDDADIRAAA
jgi:hypothetical protein